MCSGERAFKFTRNFYKYLNLSSQSSHGGGKAHVSMFFPTLWAEGWDLETGTPVYLPRLSCSEGPCVGLRLWCNLFEILPHLWTRSPAFSLCKGPCKLWSRSCPEELAWLTRGHTELEQLSKWLCSLTWSLCFLLLPYELRPPWDLWSCTQPYRPSPEFPKTLLFWLCIKMPQYFRLWFLPWQLRLLFEKQINLKTCLPVV